MGQLIDLKDKLFATIKYSDINSNYIIFTYQANGFMMGDFKASHPDINSIEILDLYVHPEFRNKGIGSALLKAVIDNNENFAILSAIGASKKEYPIEPSHDEKMKIIEDLSKFYEKNGFVDVNDLYGNYENKRAYIYLNDISEECIKNPIMKNINSTDFKDN